MWLATKYATRKPPRSRNDLVNAELGENAPHYRRLVRDYEDEPDLSIGPNETFLDHYRRLKAAKQAEMSVPLSEADMAARQRGVAGLSGGGGAPASWLKRLLEETPPSSAPVSDLKGMPQRIPGWFTGDAMDKQPPGYEIPLPRRTPGDTFRPSPYRPSPRYAPEPPTRDEWVQGLAEKGIYLNPDGTRMTPEQLAAPLPRRPTPPLPRGHDIWADLTRPAEEYAGRHRAAKAVVAYVIRALAEVPDDVVVHDGWEVAS